ncbi:MAG: D-glycerate dehydrogenase [Pelagimonas sp.]|nr:D-glycerate dehydrogenase [Pelagimonas sp.]
MKKLLITRNLPDTVVAKARAHFDLTYRDSPDVMSPAEMVASLTEYDAILPTLGDLYSTRILNSVATPRAQILANFGVGYNHIDVETAKANGITVTNTPGAVTDATSDVALTLMLMSARRAGEGERLVRTGQWQGWHPVQMLGLHMTGKSVGIVGMGRIGQAIAQRCHFGFGMRVKYFNRSEKTLGFPAERVESLTDLAAQVDFLVAAVPGGGDTHHMFNSDTFEAMPAHARFINISRGEVVDETALIKALQTRTIGGAGLDVYEHEPQVPEALRALDNAVLLPHLGTAALEVREGMGMMALDNLKAFFAGEPLPNPV